MFGPYAGIVISVPAGSASNLIDVYTNTHLENDIWSLLIKDLSVVAGTAIALPTVVFAANSLRIVDVTVAAQSIQQWFYSMKG